MKSLEIMYAMFYCRRIGAAAGVLENGQAMASEIWNCGIGSFTAPD